MPRTRAKKADEEARKGQNIDKVESEEVQEREQGHAADEADAIAPSHTDGNEKEQDNESDAGPSSLSSSKLTTMEERAQKMKELRKKMADSSMANRRAVASEASQNKRSTGRPAGLQRKLDKAEKSLEARDALERGEDWDRVKAWNYTIEDNDRWEDKLASKEETKDQGPQDINTASERQYRRLVAQMKTSGNGSGEHNRSRNTAGSSGSTSSAVTLRPGSERSGQIAQKDELYPDPTSLTYGTHKPDEAALDRVSSHLNAEADRRTKFSRKRADDGEGEVNYINDKNKHYNKKIARYFDRYTQEIRDNFERGTA